MPSITPPHATLRKWLEEVETACSAQLVGNTEEALSRCLDQGELDGVAGLELDHEGVRELAEAARLLRGRTTASAMRSRAGVLGGDALALGGSKSGGFPGVGAVGLDLTFSCHGGPRVHGDAAVGGAEMGRS